MFTPSYYTSAFVGIVCLLFVIVVYLYITRHRRRIVIGRYVTVAGIKLPRLSGPAYAKECWHDLTANNNDHQQFRIKTYTIFDDKPHSSTSSRRPTQAVCTVVAYESDTPIMAETVNVSTGEVVYYGFYPVIEEALEYGAYASQY